MCSHLVIFYCFGMLYKEKSGNPGPYLFRQANMGLTRLCDINFEMSPQKWGNLMLESYKVSVILRNLHLMWNVPKTLNS
jgi:hypothetical protein